MVNIKHTLVCTALAACPVFANAEQVVVNLTQAGTLSSVITEERKYEITDMKITGELNGDDIFLIRDLGDSYNLENLDISEAKIVSGGQAYFTLDEEHFTADNEIGDYMFYSLEKLRWRVGVADRQEHQAAEVGHKDRRPRSTGLPVPTDGRAAGFVDQHRQGGFHVMLRHYGDRVPCHAENHRRCCFRILRTDDGDTARLGNENRRQLFLPTQHQPVPSRHRPA